MAPPSTRIPRPTTRAEMWTVRSRSAGIAAGHQTVRFVVPSSSRSVERALARASTSRVTYDPGVAEHTGFEHDRFEAPVGHGDDDFAAARDGLTSWAAHDLPGVRVFPRRVPVALGATHLVTLGSSLLAIAAPCRISQVIDEPRRAGFAYVTLEGHPEKGTESFVVELDALGDVRFTVEARSRPGSAIVRVGSGPSRVVQHRIARGYVRSLERHVAGRRGPSA